MIFGINKKYITIFDPYNVLLAIATNIPVRLMTGFVIHILLFSNSISKYFISHIYHVYINTFYKWYIYNNWLQAGSYLRWSGFECSLFSCSSEVVADGCTGSSWSHNNRRTYSASAKQAENVSTTTKKTICIHWLLMTSNPVSHTPVREFQHPGTSNSYFYQSFSPQSSPNSPVRWFKEKRTSFLDEKGSKCKHGWADYTCALSNWSLSMSHVHTIVPVRPIEKNKPLHTSDTSCIHKPHWIPPNNRPFPPLQWMEITFLESAAIHSLTQAVYRSISLTALITNRAPIKPH